MNRLREQIGGDVEYREISISKRALLGIRDGDLLRLESGDGVPAPLELPALVQPGQQISHLFFDLPGGQFPGHLYFYPR